MKKITFFLVLIWSKSLIAQDIQLNSNYSIIGNSNSNSTQLLFWNGTSAYYGRKLTGMIGVNSHYFRINGETKLMINELGNVGIGTIKPDMALSIDGGIGLFRNNQYPTDYSIGFLKYEDGLILGNSSSSDPIRFQTNSIDRLYIDNNGNIGIGTSLTGTHKLAVEGSIGAREIQVEVNGWSDFVFGNDYDLRSLEETEKFIIENKHLPDIPCQKEVDKKGINLAEMDAKLLQKIEELTLYLIEQNKINQALQEKVNQLEEEMDNIRKK